MLDLFNKQIRIIMQHQHQCLHHIMIRPLAVSHLSMNNKNSIAWFHNIRFTNNPSTSWQWIIKIDIHYFHHRSSLSIRSFYFILFIMKTNIPHCFLMSSDKDCRDKQSNEKWSIYCFDLIRNCFIHLCIFRLFSCISFIFLQNTSWNNL